MRLVIAIFLLSISANSSAQEKPKYRCLAPFVWSIDDSKPPASLFEVFLKGPFDRFETGPSSGEKLLALGWESANSGDVDLAMILFRQAWEDEGNGDALVSMALHSMNVPEVAKLMAKEAVEKTSYSPWKGLAVELSKKGSMSIAELEAWCLENTPDEIVRRFVLRKILDVSEGEKLKPGWAVAASLAMPGKESKDEWMKLRFAEEAGVYPSRMSLQMRVKKAPHLLPLALRISMVKGELGEAVSYLKRVTEFDDEILISGAELAWRLDQMRAAEKWLSAWRDRPAYSVQERSQRVQKEKEIRGSWAEKPGSSLAELEEFLERNPGHVSARTKWIAKKFSEGGVRDALFAADSKIRAQIIAADTKDELVTLLKPLAEKGEWRPGWAERGEGLSMPLPPDGIPPGFTNPIEGNGIDGKTVNLAEVQEGNKGSLILFYTGVGCPACQVQLQAFQRESETWEKMGLEVIAVSAQGAKQVAEGLKTAGLDFPFTFVGDSELNAFQSFGIYDSFEEYPMHGVVVLDQQGRVRWSVRSYQPYTDVDFLAEELASLLL